MIFFLITFFFFLRDYGSSQTADTVEVDVASEKENCLKSRKEVLEFEEADLKIQDEKKMFQYLEAFPEGMCDFSKPEH